MEVDSINSNYIPPTTQTTRNTQPIETTTNETTTTPPVDQSIANRVDLIV